MGYRVANFVEATLQQAVEAGDTTFYIEAAQEALFPSLSGGNVCRCVIEDGENDPEIFDVSAHSAGALTVTRARESTSARAWPAGSIITIDITAEVINQILSAAAASLSNYSGTATGTNTIEVDLGVGMSIPVPSNGDVVSFEVANDNTGAVTLLVTNGTDDTTTEAIEHPDGRALEAGDLQAGWTVSVRWSTAQDAWILISDGSYQQHATQMNDGPLASGNLLSNGEFRAWTAATSFSDPVTGTTVADGYYVEFDGTIGNFTISRQAFTPGQTDVAGNPDYYLRWAHTVAGTGSTYRRLRTKVGRVMRFSGKKALRSIYMKADSARTVTGKIIQHFGTGGAPSSDVEAESVAFNVTTSWQRFELPDTLPSVSGKTLGSNGDDALILSLDLPLNTTMTIEFAMDQFEYGDLASFPYGEWPLPTSKGGTGGSYEDTDALIAAIGTLAGWLDQAAWEALYADLTLIEAISSSGLIFRNNTGPAWGTRSIAVGSGLTINNADGTAGNPTISLDTALANYVADPLSVAELASITGTFGTAAFQASTAFAASSLTLTAGLGLSGGGDLSSNRSFALDFSELTDTATASGDYAVFMDVNDSNTPKRRTWANVISELGIALLAGAVFTGQIQAPAGSVGAPGISIGSTDNGWYLIGTDNLGLSINGALELDASATRILIGAGNDLRLPDTLVAPTGIYSVGFRGVPVIDGNAAYAFPATDAGCTIYHDEAGTRTYTIPANASVAHPIGTTFVIDNTGNGGAAGAITLAITSDTLRRGDGTSGTGSRTIPANGVAVIRKVTATIWTITGIFS